MSKTVPRNPALEAFALLLGEWKTSGSHPYVPDTELHGRASVDWLEGGAFIMMRSELDHPKFPDGIAIFGSDNAAEKYYMLHFDERGISRKYDVSITQSQLTWWRNDPEFSQRFTMDIEKDRLVSRGEMSRGSSWEKDLALTYTRI